MNTPATLSIVEDQVLAVLRSFMLSLLADGIEVVASQDNRVPVPPGTDYIFMNLVGKKRLSTNISSTSDGFWTSGPQIRNDMVPTELTVQIDVFGPSSSDNTQIILTMFRSDWAVDQFATINPDVTPLYMTEPKQLPFSNAQQQIVTRWTMDAAMQYNPIVTTNQDFAAALKLNLVNVDAVYPPH